MEVNMFKIKQESYLTWQGILKHYQSLRDKQLGVKCFSSDQIEKIDKLIMNLLAHEKIASSLRSSANKDQYVRKALDDLIWLFDVNRITELDEWCLKNPGAEPTVDKILGFNAILFRESFYRFSYSPSIWDPIKILYNIDILEDYAKDECDRSKRSKLSQYTFFHDTTTIPFDGPNVACIYHPLYESSIIGFLLSVIAATIAGVVIIEYNEWRQRRKRRRREDLIDCLTLILFESRLRFKDLPIEKARNRQLPFLTPSQLSKIYLEQYIPNIKFFRENKGNDFPAYYREIYMDCRRTAELMIPDNSE